MRRDSVGASIEMTTPKPDETKALIADLRDSARMIRRAFGPNSNRANIELLAADALGRDHAIVERVRKWAYHDHVWEGGDAKFVEGYRAAQLAMRALAGISGFDA